MRPWIGQGTRRSASMASTSGTAPGVGRRGVCATIGRASSQGYRHARACRRGPPRRGPLGRPLGWSCRSPRRFRGTSGTSPSRRTATCRKCGSALFGTLTPARAWTTQRRSACSGTSPRCALASPACTKWRAPGENLQLGLAPPASAPPSPPPVAQSSSFLLKGLPAQVLVVQRVHPQWGAGSRTLSVADARQPSGHAPSVKHRGAPRVGSLCWGRCGRHYLSSETGHL